ncbi:general transcription factor-like protein IIH, polypeptide 3, 34kDa [Phlyctochytrium arcticum]|nr:general transcription factor-like protein IIH, polypeptide 3, 34kDa [Phlyctochytrium arcticum]
MSEDSVNLLALVIDTNPFAWEAGPTPFTSVLDNLLIFINAHLALRFDTELVVIASHDTKSLFLYPDPAGAASRPNILDKPANTYQQFYDVDHGVIRRLKELATGDDENGLEFREPRQSMLAGSISLAQSYIERIRRESPNPIQSRILIVSISPDQPSQYISMMNCIFAAQRMGTKIDVARFSSPLFSESSDSSQSVFLPQASDITGGQYLDISDPSTFLHYLLYVYLPEPHMRTLMVLPTRDQVDFRAACFCHKRVVDVGYVCSVCLSIFCSTSYKKCMTCQTEFESPTVAAPTATVS